MKVALQSFDYLPIVAHVKSLYSLQVSHFWANLLDLGYLHGQASGNPDSVDLAEHADNA